MAFDKEQAIKNAIVDGVVDIDKLLICNDFETIKEGLNNYPLTINEFLKNKYAQRDYRTVFQWAVDHQANSLADYFISNKIPSISFRRGRISNADDLIDYVIAELKGKGTKFINDKYFYTKDNSYYRYNRLIEPNVSKEEVINKILNDLSLKIDKETITAGLTREYFEKLYEQQNYELLVIKLCVRLEAILKCDYHYTGTFEEMLSQFSKEHGYTSVDDGWGYYSDEETDQYKIFHKLRKYRNDIVHAEKNQESLTSEELKKAIDYVCKLG